MFIVPHAVAKVFSFGRRKQAVGSGAVGNEARGAGSSDAHARIGAKSGATATASKARSKNAKKTAARRRPAKPEAPAPGGGDVTEVPDLDFDEGDDSDDDLPSGFAFDMQAYKDVWGETPYEDAVTALFAEYAVLYGRVARWTTSSTPPPMTLGEAASLSKHAETFVKEYIRPILGEVNTPKTHKLLRHLLGAIRMHGNLRNCNTSTNEAGHKKDKKFYNRTNKIINTFPAQLARQSQGTQAVLARLADEVAVAIRADKLRRQRRSLARGGKLTSMTKRSIHKVPRIAVGALAQRPGLGRLASVLGMDPNVKVPVLGQVKFLAELDCGTRLPQTLRASENYRRKGAWFDAIVYTVAGEAPVVDASGTANVRLHYGEVRALVRHKEEDVAVVCDMDAVEADAACPLGQRECTRLKWRVPAAEQGSWSITAVPVSRVRRVVHVVPDFGELSARLGVKALPARYTASVDERRDMRYYENAFYPWG